MLQEGTYFAWELIHPMTLALFLCHFAKASVQDTMSKSTVSIYIINHHFNVTQFGYKLRQSIFIKVAKPFLNSEEIPPILCLVFALSSYLATIKHLERERNSSVKDHCLIQSSMG